MNPRTDEADQAVTALNRAIDILCKVGSNPAGMDLLSAHFSDLAQNKWLLDVLMSRLRPITRDMGFGVNAHT